MMSPRHLVLAVGGACLCLCNSSVATDQKGGCCLFDGTCLEGVLADECLAIGVPLGDHVSCTADPDGDGAVGCDDLCPADKERTEPGRCGCATNEPVDGTAPCLPAMVMSEPPNCAIDPRYPHEQYGAARPVWGWNSFDLTFQQWFDTASLTPDDIALSFYGGYVRFPPAVSLITDLGSNTVRVELDSSIPIHRWTCIDLVDRPRNTKPLLCFGRLPGDVNGDGTANAADAFGLLDWMYGRRTLDTWQCDINLDGVCRPTTEILNWADLINGVGFSDFYNNTILVGDCPSAP